MKPITHTPPDTALITYKIWQYQAKQYTKPYHICLKKSLGVLLSEEAGSIINEYEELNACFHISLLWLAWVFKLIISWALPSEFTHWVRQNIFNAWHVTWLNTFKLGQWNILTTEVSSHGLDVISSGPVTQVTHIYGLPVHYHCSFLTELPSL